MGGKNIWLSFDASFFGVCRTANHIKKIRRIETAKLSYCLFYKKKHYPCDFDKYIMIIICYKSCQPHNHIISEGNRVVKQ